MKRNKIKIGIVFGLAFLMTGIISSVNAVENPGNVEIVCGSIILDTSMDPDTCQATPQNHYDIDVGQYGTTIVVDVSYYINCASWDDHGFVNISFVEFPGTYKNKQTGDTASGTLEISHFFGPGQQFTICLYGHIWYDHGGPSSEITKYAYCTTKVWVPPNHAPNKPTTPSGPTSVNKGEYNEWWSSAVDIDGDNIYMRWDWGDGTPITDWNGPYTSGETVYGGHTYSTKGSYSIKCQAKDTYDWWSLWSDYLPIVVPTDQPN